MREKGDSSKNKKIVFMGTPNIATYALNSLNDCGFDVVAVVTQPDKPIGRNKKIVFSDVKQLAIEKNIKIFQPNKIGEIKNELQDLKPFAFVTCAFGQFIPSSILEIPEFGTVNIHASLLPKYRGGAPIHWAIINGEKETGVSLMETIKKMDAGKVYSNMKTEIFETDTTTTLFNKMNKLVYEIIARDLNKVFNKELLGIEQDESKVSFAYNITKENEKLNFNDSASNIINWIKGLSDTPGAYCYLKEKKVKLFNAAKTNVNSTNKPGTIVDINKNGLIIATKDYDICVHEVQVEGKNRTQIKNIINGKHDFIKKEVLV